VPDPHWGAAYDIGRYEAGFGLTATPSAHAIAPGGTAQYVIGLYPADLPYSVTLSVISPSPELTLAVAPAVITAGSVATLTVTDTHTGTLAPGLWYTIPITGVGGGFTQTASVRLLVGGARVYLPVTLRNR